MTLEAQMEISRILLIAEGRLVGANGPFAIIHRMLNDYFREFGWI